MCIFSFIIGEKNDIQLSIKVGDTAVSAAQDRGHDALALQIARYISCKKNSANTGLVILYILLSATGASSNAIVIFSIKL